MKRAARHSIDAEVNMTIMKYLHDVYYYFSIPKTDIDNFLKQPHLFFQSHTHRYI